MGLSTYRILKNVQTSNRIELSGETLKDLQRTLLEILQDFADICKKYGFYYSICGGTALGAVRHGGFIPWDDDIDVFMLRKDYEKFLEIFKTELSEKYYLKSMETTPEIGMPITQLMKRGTIFRTTNSLPEDDSGVYIDICILDSFDINYTTALIFAYFGGMYIFNTALTTVANGLSKMKSQIIVYGLGAIIKIPALLVLKMITDNWNVVTLYNALILTIFSIVEMIILKKMVDGWIQQDN